MDGRVVSRVSVWHVEEGDCDMSFRFGTCWWKVDDTYWRNQWDTLVRSLCDMLGERRVTFLCG